MKIVLRFSWNTRWNKGEAINGCLQKMNRSWLLTSRVLALFLRRIQGNDMKVFASSSNTNGADGCPFTLQLGVEIHSVGCQGCWKCVGFQEGYWAGQGRQIFRGLLNSHGLQLMICLAYKLLEAGEVRKVQEPIGPDLFFCSYRVTCF